MGEDGDDARGDAFRNLRAVVYVEVPRAVMRMSDDDAFEALRAYAPEEHEAEAETEAEAPRETLANGGERRDGERADRLGTSGRWR